MYKNTEFMYKYARTFEINFQASFFAPAKAFLGLARLIPVFPHRGSNERSL
jgi:hypothetical protein